MGTTPSAPAWVVPLWKRSDDESHYSFWFPLFRLFRCLLVGVLKIRFNLDYRGSGVGVRGHKIIYNNRRGRVLNTLSYDRQDLVHVYIYVFEIGGV
jgi:hypothetical protein